MKAKCFFLVSAFSLVPCYVQAGLADAPNGVIDQFVILVHPCPYEGLGRPETDPYRALERAACQRWFQVIPSLPKCSFVVEIDFGVKGASPDKLHKAFVDRLGAGHVTRVPVEAQGPENPDSLTGYYQRIDRQIRRQMAAHELTFDPATARAIVWGQSFEGCASGYGSAIASYLGLKTPTRFDYRMSAPDAPFLLKARFLRTMAIPASDVEAHVFDLCDGRYAAFFRSCLTPQWLDYRPIVLRLDPNVFSVLTKNEGLVVWPNGIQPSEKSLKSSRFNQWRTVPWPPGTPTAGPHSFTLSTVQERFVVGRNLEALISVIKSAEVKSQTQ